MSGAPGDEELQRLTHVALTVSAELGACRMLVREVLQLGSGSIVVLDRPVARPVDLLVNGRLVARGDVVAVDERFGVRITELVGTP